MNGFLTGYAVKWFSSNNSRPSFCLSSHHHLKRLLARVRACPKVVEESLQPLGPTQRQQHPLPVVTVPKGKKNYLLGGKTFCYWVLLLLFVLFYIHTYLPIKNCHSFSHNFAWKAGNFEVVVIWRDRVTFSIMGRFLPSLADICLLNQDMGVF